MTSRLPAPSVARLLAVLLSLSLIAAACGDDASSEAEDAGSADMSADGHASDADTSHDDDHDHDHDDHDEASADDDHGHDHAHDHEGVEFEGADAPSLAVDVTADPAGGINVFVTAANFRVAPEAASTDHVEGEGHFHLYIDGEKVLRFYNDAVYFSGVTEGEIEVMVELSANDHSTYTLGGEPITATAVFTVPAHDHGHHSHDAPEELEYAGDAPTLEVRVEPDPKSGHNVFVTLDGMTLSAEHASGDHFDGEGHLHIYANGQKLGRLYGLATHVPALPDGEVEISVGAYSNDHRPYVVDGEPVSASTTITVAG